MFYYPKWLHMFLALITFFRLVNTSWWYLGIVGVYKMNSPFADSENPRQVDSTVISSPVLSCDQPHLNPIQQRYCKKQSSGFDRLLMAVSQGAEWGIKECQYQFRGRHWNCATFNNDTSVFGKILQKDNREKAFIYAISCAGVVSAVMRRCAKGDIMELCRCDERAQMSSKNQQLARDSKFKWGGCSQDWTYASSFSRQFLDKTENPREPSGLMARWNNRAGRKSVKHNMRLMCKCHGLSGSCSTKVCWRSVKPFRAIGTFLKNKFDGAAKVKFVIKSGERRGRMQPHTQRQKKPNKRDLVYLEDSPNFCSDTERINSVSTQGRPCNNTSLGVDGCTLLCCERGYSTIQEQIVEDCDCKFIWCCNVVCKKCRRTVDKHYCK